MVGVATAIAVLDVFFILVAVPESLPEKLRLSSTWSAAHISWENADPFSVRYSTRVYAMIYAKRYCNESRLHFREMLDLGESRSSRQERLKRPSPAHLFFGN